MSEYNKTLVRRFYQEVENEGNLDLIDELFDPNFRDVYNTVAPFPIVGAEAVKKLAAALKSMMDIHLEIADLVAEDDLVVARLSGHITQKFDFMGVPPTNRQFPINGVEIFRVANGKLSERWVFIDQLPMMQELGVVPSPGRG